MEKSDEIKFDGSESHWGRVCVCARVNVYMYSFVCVSVCIDLCVCARECVCTSANASQRVNTHSCSWVNNDLRLLQHT